MWRLVWQKNTLFVTFLQFCFSSLVLNVRLVRVSNLPKRETSNYLEQMLTYAYERLCDEFPSQSHSHHSTSEKPDGMEIDNTNETKNHPETDG